MDLQDIIDDVERHAPDDPLDRLVTAAFRQQWLADLGDQLLDHFVQAAREAGCSWAQIGEALGVSKQAAQQRHGATDKALDGLVDWLKGQGVGRGRRRFERFTQAATRAVVRAQELAREMGHDSTGTEHVLVALVEDEKTVAGKILAGWSISRGEVVAAVDARHGDDEQAPNGHIPFSAGAKKALELALREALALGHNYIGTEHLLLGIAHDEPILRDREVTPAKAREAVTEALEDLLAGRATNEGPSEQG